MIALLGLEVLTRNEHAVEEAGAHAAAVGRRRDERNRVTRRQADHAALARLARGREEARGVGMIGDREIARQVGPARDRRELGDGKGGLDDHPEAKIVAELLEARGGGELRTQRGDLFGQAERPRLPGGDVERVAVDRARLQAQGATLRCLLKRQPAPGRAFEGRLLTRSARRSGDGGSGGLMRQASK